MLGINIDKCLVLRTSYNRENLNYYVETVSGSTKSTVSHLYELIRKKYSNKSGIVYCFSQKDTEDVSSELKNLGLKSAPYHANLDFNYRSKVHSDWVQGRIHVIVATVAFGMGIDKSDVRFVIHYSTSKSLENYYQESGRAGRDSQPADCILMWRYSDLFRLASMVSSERTGIEKLLQMIEYCINPDKCRRYLLSKHLGDTSWSIDDCKNACDNCQRKCAENSDKSYHLVQIKITELLEATKELLYNQSLTKQERITGLKLVDLMTNSNKKINSISQKLLNDAVTNTTISSNKVVLAVVKPEREFYEYFISWCLIKEYLKLDFHFTPYSTVCYVVVNDDHVTEGGDDGDDATVMPYLLLPAEEKEIEKCHVPPPQPPAKRQRVDLTDSD
uniref:ATP-dependent DNA helicase n=1 Tax=Trichobilharzia regenti TaxID=157069 RepID=A0AA85JHA2_TRIRE|nr:unnamed protein product [Trichobilharzia regenti]